jgi:hypothetical protein
MSLAFPDQLKKAAIAYRDFRLYKDTFQVKGSSVAIRITSSTVRREFNILHRIFEVAKEELFLR